MSDTSQPELSRSDRMAANALLAKMRDLPWIFSTKPGDAITVAVDYGAYPTNITII